MVRYVRGYFICSQQCNITRYSLGSIYNMGKNNHQERIRYMTQNSGTPRMARKHIQSMYDTNNRTELFQTIKMNTMMGGVRGPDVEMRGICISDYHVLTVTEGEADLVCSQSAYQHSLPNDVL